MNLIRYLAIKLIMLGDGGDIRRIRNSLRFRLACAAAHKIGDARGYIDGQMVNRFGTTLFERPPDKKLLGRRQ